MRSKTRGGRARLSKLPSPIPNTRSLPFISLIQDEQHGDCSIDRTEHEMSSKKSEDGQHYNDAVASRSSKKETDVCADLDRSIDFMDLDSDSDSDSLEIKPCILCNRGGGGDVLVCSEIGCPIAIHDNCLKPQLPEFDESGKFCCPYCFYKRKTQMKQKLRKKAMEAKKCLSVFLDFKVSSDDNVRMNEERDREKEPNVLPPGGERNHVDREDKVVTNQVEDHFVPLESQQQDKEDNIKLSDFFSRPKTVVEHQRDLIAPISHQGDKIRHGHEKLPGVESTVDCIGKEQSGEQKSDSDTEIPLTRQRRRTIEKKAQPQNVEKKARTSEKKAQPQNVEKKARPQNVDSPKKFSSPKSANPVKINKTTKQQASPRNFLNLPFANEKRKRQHWKTEEEEMLREAVHKFSSTVNKNLPWRKILESGHHVFDPTRNPTDLKDKWRNMMAKESSSVSRR
ncbi:hypothetical protein Ddye_015207 [Dipteronia dyeriana]|uniref:Myb-like domain-containing protein n=1 Tax=Dipteronia dyeriana TaxID=168575 RepID=A0AAD9WYY4_9ROSI|nr:hypothetical protein Ddye_015207 [Dipteronia dyeriana]